MDIDINLVLHARDYIDDLAKGINPLTKEEIKDDDILNNVKIARCLFYVSDILDAVIVNGETNIYKSQKPKLDEIDLEKVILDKFEFSSDPILVSEIVRRINKLIPENMKKLKATAITNWLIDIDVLYATKVNGKTRKQPTENASKLGISMVQREGQYGVFDAVVYNESAQHFIIDNLHAVVEGGYNKGKKKT